MSTPNMRTPVDTTLLILRDMIPWHERFADQVDDMIVNAARLKTQLPRQIKALDAAQAHYESERRDDVALTDQQRLLVEAMRTLIRGARHAASVAFAERRDVAKLVNDFGSSRPSRDIRTTDHIFPALRRLQEALTRHRDVLDASVRVTDALDKRATALSRELEALHTSHSRELTETHNARELRHQAHQDAIALIRQAYDQAQLAAVLHGDEALRALLLVFTRYLTSGASGKSAATPNTPPQLDEDDLDTFDDTL